MQNLPGFRDFYPEDCVRRNYILETWRSVARRYGFIEYDGPVLEPVELYEKKSGGELVGQLFDFTDKGERQVTLRPEMTPTLARMVAARERDFKKPMKWFCVPQFFRYERPQRGRGREFYQMNADIIGEASPAADAELIATAIDTLRAFGLDESHFIVRLSSRNAWQAFFQEAGERRRMRTTFSKSWTRPNASPWKRRRRRSPGSESRRPKSWNSCAARLPRDELAAVLADLTARGLGAYAEIDYAIVRGLAYYTGVVFEVFDRGKTERALAGGGRYDRLLSVMSDGKVDLPALGFGMGDVVLGLLIAETPAAKARMDEWLARDRPVDIYIIIAKEERRADALAIVQRLREAGHRTDFPLAASKVGKQYQTAEQLGASRAVLVGDEWPQVKVKTLVTREEVLIPVEELSSYLNQIAGGR